MSKDNALPANHPPPVRAAEVTAESGTGYPEPFGSQMGKSEWRRLGERFGLTQFGINLETYQPGAQTSMRHWHTLSDEFVYVLEGELTLHTNAGAVVLTPGMCVGFKAAVRDGHHFVNESNAPAHCLVMGSRIPGDNAFYPDDDMMWVRTEDGPHAAHKDGTPYARPGKRNDSSA